MTRRNPALVVLFTLLTLGVYAYYWLYVTTRELAEESGDESLHPVVDVILAVLTLGLWGAWAGYRNARLTHRLLEARGERHEDRSLAVLGFAALSLFSGWAWLVALAILQDDLNQLAEPLDVFEAVDAAPPATRVEVPREAEPEPMEAPAPSRWAQAPSAPVFLSDAPAPRVF